MEIILGVSMFTAIVLALVLVILFAKSKLVSSGDITININGDPDKAVVTAAGGKLLGALAEKGIFIPSACGGGGGGQGSDGKVKSDALLKGQFIDSPVSNIAYRTESQSGFTNSEGEYSYLLGESVTFSIGGINLPTTLAKGVLTPLDLAETTSVSDISVSNIARLLQSIDRDNDPANGIQIDDLAHTYAEDMALSFESIEFENNPNVTNLIANSGSINAALLSPEVAQAHLQSTLDELDGSPTEDNSAPSVNAGEDRLVNEQLA